MFKGKDPFIYYYLLILIVKDVVNYTQFTAYNKS